MTPAERDEVRVVGDAVGRGCYGFDDAEARRWLQLLARAVLRYVPPGDVVINDVVNIDDVSVEARTSTNPVVMTVCKPVGSGRKWRAQRCLSIAEARSLAHAIHAAADAAEES